MVFSASAIPPPRPEWGAAACFTRLAKSPSVGALMRFPPLAAALLLAFTAFLPASRVLAAIEFEASEIVLKPAVEAPKLEAAFKFKNTGDAPVTITRVHSSCGCTVPEKPAEAIAPGASGEIPVVYKTTGRQGRQTQSIQVETSDGKTHELRLVADLPVRVAFAPRLLLFHAADAEAKIATVTYSSDPKTELVGVAVSSAAFEIVGEPRLETGVVKISIRHIGPADAEARGSVRVTTRDTGGEHVDNLYVRHAP